MALPAALSAFRSRTGLRRVLLAYGFYNFVELACWLAIGGITCSGVCVDSQTDRANCGACANTTTASAWRRSPKGCGRHSGATSGSASRRSWRCATLCG